MLSHTRALAKYCFVFPCAIALAGCSRAPSVDVMGSFFPGWLVSVIMGIGLAGAARLVLPRLKIKVAVPILVYAGLAAIFTFVWWLLFYG